jgi:L-asparaginase
MNLYNAVAVAGSAAARPCGVMVAFNDQIHSARYVYKTDTTRPDASQSVDRGRIGTVDTGHVDIFGGCARDAFPAPKIPIADIRELPKVEIVYAYAGMGRDLIDAAVQALAGLRDARAKGAVVVRSTCVVSGFTLRDAEVNDATEGLVAAEEFKPSKARVLLQIALLKTSSPTEIQKYFDSW